MGAKINKPHSVLIYIMLALATLLFILPVASTATSTYSRNKSNSFIRTRCRKTDNPKQCYRSLTPYAKTIGDHPARMAQIGIAVALSKAQQMASYLTNLSRKVNDSKPFDPLVVKALSLCEDMYKHAVSEYEESNNIMLHLNRYKGDELEHILEDVDVSTDLARSYEGICVKGWNGVADGPMKYDIFRRTLKMVKFTDNARDLLEVFDKRLSS